MTPGTVQPTVMWDNSALPSMAVMNGRFCDGFTSPLSQGAIKPAPLFHADLMGLWKHDLV